MAYGMMEGFFDIINISLFNYASVLLIICFIVWELPRSVKILPEEYTKDLYPEKGRVVDIALFAVGLIFILYLMLGNNAVKTISLMKTPGITAFLLVVLVVVPLIIILSFLKRFFARIEGHSVSVFLTQGLLDLMHTVFYISLSLLAIPALSYLLLGGMIR